MMYKILCAGHCGIFLPDSQASTVFLGTPNSFKPLIILPFIPVGEAYMLHLQEYILGLRPKKSITSVPICANFSLRVSAAIF